MTQAKLKKAFKEAKENKCAICVEIEMPGQDTAELIINDWSALDNKLDYYLKAYDKKLVHSMNDRIKIIDAYPCDYYTPKFMKKENK